MSYVNPDPEPERTTGLEPGPGSRPAILRPAGILLMVHSQLSGPEETPARLRTAGLRAEVINRARLPFGRVLRHRPAWLRERKLVTDRMTEELVVIHAEHA